jgi:hypothetical protein
MKNPKQPLPTSVYVIFGIQIITNVIVIYLMLKYFL